MLIHDFVCLDAPAGAVACLVASGTRTREDAVVVPVRWEATGISWLFPVLEADLEFVPIGDGAAQLNLWGS